MSLYDAAIQIVRSVSEWPAARRHARVVGTRSGADLEPKHDSPEIKRLHPNASVGIRPDPNTGLYTVPIYVKPPATVLNVLLMFWIDFFALACVCCRRFRCRWQTPSQRREAFSRNLSDL